MKKTRRSFSSSEKAAIVKRQTANTFHLTAATISAWMHRLDESGPDALVQLRKPVNKFPEFVRYAVQRLKALCPNMGKVKIAEVLARARLHLASSTVGRMLNEEPSHPRSVAKMHEDEKRVTADRPNHVWHVDLTTVPITDGLWAPWIPFALPQRWPFCWWVAIVLDHYSRRVMGFAVFEDRTTSVAMRTFLGRTVRRAGSSPKYAICDKGVLFWCEGFKDWCRRRDIKPRFGAVGQHASIAVIERFIGTMKREGTRRRLIPMRRAAFRNELDLFVDWYNEHRPNSALDGHTPNEVYHGLRPANRRPRCEPRLGWPRPSECAKPPTLVAGQPGTEFTLKVDFLEGRKHLPTVTLKRAA